MHRSTPSFRHSTRGRSARGCAGVAALALVATACGGGSGEADDVAGDDPTDVVDGDPTEVADGGAATGSATFTRGEAALPLDLCAGDGHVVADVLHLDDLAAAGLPLGPDAKVNDRNDPAVFSESGRTSCTALLGKANIFSIRIDRTSPSDWAPDSDGESEVREQRTIAGKQLDVHRTISVDTGDGVVDLVTWAGVTFPDEFGRDGVAAFWIGYNSIGDEGALSEDEATDALIAIGELVLPLITFDLPNPAGTETEASAPGDGPTTPPWWVGCDTDDFVLEGFDADTMFAAIDEPGATSVELSDNPLGGLFTDCRATNGTTRLSVAAVPPIGGLIESVDTILADEADAEERTIAGQRTAVYSLIEGLTSAGVVHLNADGFSIIVTAEDRDQRGLSAAELKDMAVAVAEAFLGQL